jgi:hypothetical protein
MSRHVGGYVQNIADNRIIAGNVPKPVAMHFDPLKPVSGQTWIRLRMG